MRTGLGMEGVKEEMETALGLLPFVSGGLVFGLLMILAASGRTEQLVLSANEELQGFLKRGKNTAWYQRRRIWLQKNGAEFHYGKWVDPLSFLTVKLLSGAAGYFVLSVKALEYGIFAGIFLFFLPDILLTYLNKKDNERLLSEIKLVYHSLEIQIRAGVYVTDVLSECYASVREKRMRAAFLDLAGDIVMKADIYDALERFQGKFDNRYIDSLCIIIYQALESGQALELLNDIGEQIKDMETALLERKKNALDRSMTFYQLGVLGAVLGVALYACVTDMFAAAAGF